MDVPAYMLKAYPTWTIKIVTYLPTHPTGWYDHSAQVLIETKDGFKGKCRMSKQFILEAAANNEYKQHVLKRMAVAIIREREKVNA